MKHHPKQKFDLSLVDDPVLDLHNPFHGELCQNGLTCQVNLDSENILSVMAHFPLDNPPKPEADFWRQLFAGQFSLGWPVKFVSDDSYSQIRIVAETPVTNSETLQTGYLVLKEGMTALTEWMASSFPKTPDLPLSTPASAGTLVLKEMTALVEKQLNGSYDYSRKDDFWLVVVNTNKFFQRIFIRFDTQTGVLNIRTKLSQIPREREQTIQAAVLFLLGATGRIRFVRGWGKFEGNKNTVGLEIAIPSILLKNYNLNIALDSLILGISFLRSPIEALLHDRAASAYLQTIRGMTEEKSY